MFRRASAGPLPGTGFPVYFSKEYVYLLSASSFRSDKVHTVLTRVCVLERFGVAHGCGTGASQGSHGGGNACGNMSGFAKVRMGINRLPWWSGKTCPFCSWPLALPDHEVMAANPLVRASKGAQHLPASNTKAECCQHLLFPMSKAPFGAVQNPRNYVHSPPCPKNTVVGCWNRCFASWRLAGKEQQLRVIGMHLRLLRFQRRPVFSHRPSFPKKETENSKKYRDQHTNNLF